MKHFPWYSIRMTEADKKRPARHSREFQALAGGIAEIAQKHGLALVVLFGSQANGFTHTESDVDIAYFSDRKLSFEEETTLNSDLIPVFKNDKISLVNIKKAPPLLLKQIATNAIVLYEKNPHLFTEIFLYALRTYEEAKPLFELREHYLKRRIGEYKNAG